jgi:hypothetical protein
MFHVAPLLPFYPNDKQQLERKRHLGNDIVVIVFQDAEEPFSPAWLKSEFNHIFVIVTPVEDGKKVSRMLFPPSEDEKYLRFSAFFP